jgi:tRNA (mo5U34)-methyltransferase
METAGSGARGTQRFVVTEAERRFADLSPIEVAPELARATVQVVPFWFHTCALNRPEGINTPGVARDHRYRVAILPADFAGMRVLDVRTFDGFYAFLAERGGAERVLAVVNEQYRLWIASRWGIKLAAERDFARTIPCWARRSGIRRMDAFALDGLDERFAAAIFIGWRTRWGCCVCCVAGRSAAGRC